MTKAEARRAMLSSQNVTNETTNTIKNTVPSTPTTQSTMSKAEMRRMQQTTKNVNPVASTLANATKKTTYDQANLENQFRQLLEQNKLPITKTSTTGTENKISNTNTLNKINTNSIRNKSSIGTKEITNQNKFYTGIQRPESPAYKTPQEITEAVKNDKSFINHVANDYSKYDTSVYERGNPMVQAKMKIEDFADKNNLKIDYSSKDAMTDLYNQASSLDQSKKDELAKYINTYNKVKQEDIENANYIGNKAISGLVSNVGGAIDSAIGMANRLTPSSLWDTAKKTWYKNVELPTAGMLSFTKGEDKIKQEISKVEDKINKVEESQAQRANKVKEQLRGNVIGTTGELLQQRSQDIEQAQNIGTMQKLAGDVVEGMTGMAPTILLSVATSNPDLALNVMSSSAGGNAYRQAINNGYNSEQAFNYGALMAVKEYATEKMFGTANKLAGFDVKGYGDELSESVLNLIFKENGNKILKGITEYAMGGLEEGLEEFVGDIVEPYISNLTLGTQEKANLKNALYSGLVGGITGLAMSTPGTVSNAINNVKSRNVANNTQNIVENSNIQPNAQNTVENQNNVPMQQTNQAQNKNENITQNNEPIIKNSVSEQQKSIKENNNLELLQETEKDIQKKVEDYFYNDVLASDLPDNFKNRVASLIENVKTSDGLQKVQKMVNDYKSETPDSSVISQRIEDVNKYLQERNSSTRGLSFKSSELTNVLLDNLGVERKGNSVAIRNTVQKINELINEGKLTKTNATEIINSLQSELKVENNEYYKENKQLRNEIKNQKVYVSDNVKKGFSNWKDTYRESQGNIKVTNDTNAIPVDSYYKELSDNRPDLFPSDIVNPSDQLQKIIEVSRSMKETTQKMSNIMSEKDIASLSENVANKLVEMRDNLAKDTTRIKKEGPEERKTRSWTETANKNDLVSNFINTKELKYTVLSNTKTTRIANNTLDSLGYDGALKEFNAKYDSNLRIKPEDIALGERLIQEAIKQGEYERASDLVQKVTILGTELGQTVQAMSMISKLTPEGQLAYMMKIVDRMNKTQASKTKTDLKKLGTEIVEGTQEKLNLNNNIEIPQELKNNLLKAQTTEQIEKAVDDIKQSIANQMEVSTIERLNEWRYLSMLGNPKTHIRNILANVAMRGTYTAKNQIQRAIETIVQPETRTRTYKKSSEAVKKFAKQSSFDATSLINGQGKMNISDQIKSMRKIFGDTLLEKARIKNSELLDAEDLFFSRSAYEKNLSEYLTANGIKTEQDINWNPQVVQDGIKFAIQEAQKTTFRQYSAIASTLNQMENNGPVGKILVGGIVPFKKTPINIAKTGASYSPLGLVETLTYETSQLKKGNINVNEYIDRISQGLTGTALMGLGYILANAGVLKGSGDDKEEQFKEDIGKSQSYSIKIGNKHYDISWMSPSVMPMFMGSELYNAMANKEFNSDNIVDAFSKTIDPLSSMSMLSGLNSTLKSYSTEGNIGFISNVVKNATKSYAGQFTPTVFGQINKVIDNTVRSTKASKTSPLPSEVDNFIRQQANKIPGASFLLEPATDIWGNEIKRSDNTAYRVFDAFINPGTLTEDKSTKTDDKLLKLYEETGTDIFPSTPKNYFKVNNEKYEMSAKEYTQFKKTYGQTAYKEITKILNSDKTNEEKVEDIQKAYTEAQNKARSEYGFNIDSLVTKYGENEAAKRYLGTDLLKKYDKASSNGISLIDFYNAYEAQKNAEGKKNAKGDTIQGSKKKAQRQAIIDLELDSKDKDILYGIFNLK